MIEENYRLSKEQMSFLKRYLELSQKDLAKMFMTSQATMSRWLSGKQKIPVLAGAWLQCEYPEIYNEMMMDTSRT